MAIKINNITESARQGIRNNSVAVLPANASESGLSADALQELFVSPIINESSSMFCEHNAAIAEINTAFNDVETAIVRIEDKADKAATKTELQNALQTALEWKIVV